MNFVSLFSKVLFALLAISSELESLVLVGAVSLAASQGKKMEKKPITRTGPRPRDQYKYVDELSLTHAPSVDELSLNTFDELSMPENLPENWGPQEWATEGSPLTPRFGGREPADGDDKTPPVKADDANSWELVPKDDGARRIRYPPPHMLGPMDLTK